MKDHSASVKDVETTDNLCSSSLAACSTELKSLIVALNGGSLTVKYFDINSKHTVAGISYDLDVPFVAINRPGYMSVTSTPRKDRHQLESACWLKEIVLPVVWEIFDQRSCTSIVLLGHSMATPITILTMVLHVREQRAKSPLAGIIISAKEAAPRLSSPLENIKGQLPGRLDFLLTDHSLFGRSYFDHIKDPGHIFILRNEQMALNGTCLTRWNGAWRLRCQCCTH